MYYNIVVVQCSNATGWTLVTTSENGQCYVNVRAHVVPVFCEGVARRPSWIRLVQIPTGARDGSESSSKHVTVVHSTPALKHRTAWRASESACRSRMLERVCPEHGRHAERRSRLRNLALEHTQEDRRVHGVVGC